MKKSAKCLKSSINGESTAVQMYTEFATVAVEEKFPIIATLFRALAHAETIHIKNHMSALREPEYKAVLEDYEINNTVENIKSAIAGETYEYKKMYPRFFKEIKTEQNSIYGKVALLSMQWSSKVEQNHAKTLKLAQKCINKGLDFTETDIYVCKVCGNLELSKPSKPCTICGHDVAFFEIIK